MCDGEGVDNSLDNLTLLGSNRPAQYISWGIHVLPKQIFSPDHVDGASRRPKAQRSLNS